MMGKIAKSNSSLTPSQKDEIIIREEIRKSKTLADEHLQQHLAHQNLRSRSEINNISTYYVANELQISESNSPNAAASIALYVVFVRV